MIYFKNQKLKPRSEISLLRGKLEKGIAAIFLTILVLVIMFAIAISLNILTLGQQRISRNIIESSQAYYAAEAGIEDALLRLKRDPWVSSLSYNMDVGGASTNVNVPEIIGGSRTVISQGNFLNRIRKVRAVYKIDVDAISFYYGAQVGDGGMVMGNNARVKGNIFSNGSVIAEGGRGFVDNSVIVARNGNKIKGLDIGEDAFVHTCEDSTIGRNLTYVSGGSPANCTAGGTIASQPNEILPQDLPISLSQINEWKTEAVSGGIINDDVVYNGVSQSLGPIQIGTPSQPKNLIVTNNGWLKVTGTIYVTGNIIFSNNVIIELDRTFYSSFSGVIIADGRITVENNAVLRGSGETGSYILILSTNNSLDPANPAILIGNNAAGAIFYTNSGLIYLSNNIIAREVTGYKIKINNNAEIQYESGLQNSLFSNGPGGSWELVNWSETE